MFTELLLRPVCVCVCVCNADLQWQRQKIEDVFLFQWCNNRKKQTYKVCFWVSIAQTSITLFIMSLQEQELIHFHTGKSPFLTYEKSSLIHYSVLIRRTFCYTCYFRSAGQRQRMGEGREDRERQVSKVPRTSRFFTC